MGHKSKRNVKVAFFLPFPKQKLTKKNEHHCQPLPFLSVCYLKCTLTTCLCILWQQNWQYLPNKLMLSFTKDLTLTLSFLSLLYLTISCFIFFASCLIPLPVLSPVVVKFYVLGQIPGIYFSAIAIFRSTGQEFWPVWVNSITKWPRLRGLLL